MAPFDIQTYLKEKKDLIDTALDKVLPPENEFPPQLHRAMRYCLFAGGKRIRPVLALAAAEAVGSDPAALLNEACALELIHTYTLIHDDLPAMDDDDYRRGCPSTHKIFGEAAAILAGDALLAEAFGLLTDGLSNGAHKAEKIVQVVRIAAAACGSRGVIGGQIVDLESEGKTIEKDRLEYIHTHKTASLMCASILLGAVLGNGREVELRRLTAYGNAIGLAFQITDDILDVVGTTEQLGKTVGSDSSKGKATYPSILGMPAAQKRQDQLYCQAIAALEPFDTRAQPLREIARLIIERHN